MAWTAEEAKANAAKAAAARAAKKAGAGEGEPVAKTKAAAGLSPLVQGAIAVALAAAGAFLVGKVLKRRQSGAAPVPSLEPVPAAPVPAAEPVAFEPASLAEPARLMPDAGGY